SGGCELVAAVVVGVIGMSAYPNETKPEFLGQIVETQPEVPVLFSSFEIGGDPVLQPAVLHCLYDILAVGVDGDLQPFFFQGFETGDDGHQLHPVIGGIAVAAGQFPGVFAPEEDGAISAGARITAG